MQDSTPQKRRVIHRMQNLPTSQTTYKKKHKKNHNKTP